MESAFLHKLKVRAQKVALYSQDPIRLSNFTSVEPTQVHVSREPYPHLVVENFFKPDVYDSLCAVFNSTKSKGLSNEKKGATSQFHLFDMDYDGYVYLPPASLDPQDPLSIFFSLEWNWFFSKLFKQFTSFETTVALHHHPAGDRTGFVHNDFVDMPFLSSRRLPNGMIYSGGGQSDSKRRRAISILYYLNNEPWKEGDGGETGVYGSDKSTLLKTVPPINNTLFAFQTSPTSFHAFQENHVERNSIVQWFHIPPQLL